MNVGRRAAQPPVIIPGQGQALRQGLEAPPLPKTPDQLQRAKPNGERDLSYVVTALREEKAAERAREDQVLDVDDADEEEAAAGTAQIPEDDLAEMMKRATKPDGTIDADAMRAEIDAMHRRNRGESQIDEHGAPDWFRMPPGGLPGDIDPGSAVIFLRFPVWITNLPRKGERQCALRDLTPKLEDYAYSRATGRRSSLSISDELAKASICVVDGSHVDFFGGGSGSVNHFWSEIGPRGRELIRMMWIKTHRCSDEERKRFLEECRAIRSAV